MANLTIYKGGNSQRFTLHGLVDMAGNPVSVANITASIMRNGADLPGGALTFTPVSGTPGDFSADLNGFDAASGNAQLVLTGTANGATFNLTEFVTIAERVL